MTKSDRIRQMPMDMRHCDVARALDVSVNLVRSVRRRDANVEAWREQHRQIYRRNAVHGGFGYGNAPVDEIKRRRAMGQSFRKIADDLGVGYGAVASVVRRYCNEAPA